MISALKEHWGNGWMVPSVAQAFWTKALCSRFLYQKRTLDIMVYFSLCIREAFVNVVIIMTQSEPVVKSFLPKDHCRLSIYLGGLVYIHKWFLFLSFS